MASQKQNLKRLGELRSKISSQIDKLNSEIERLKAQLSGVEMAIRTLSDENKSALTGGDFSNVINHPRRDLKSIILGLLKEAGDGGLNASMIVNRAHLIHGLELSRTTVSSLLSRYKANNLITFDGRLYHLKNNDRENQTGEANVL